jgi:hypothetical protein
VANDYPLVVNGQPVDADAWFNAIAEAVTAATAQINTLPAFVRKSSDETRSSLATLAADGELAVAFSTNSTYLVDIRLVYNSNSTADFAFRFTETSAGGVTGLFDALCVLTGATALTMQSRTLTASWSVEGQGVDTTILIRGVLVTGANSGQLVLEWCQNTNNASNTIVRANSYMRLVKAA